MKWIMSRLAKLVVVVLLATSLGGCESCGDSQVAVTIDETAPGTFLVVFAEDVFVEPTETRDDDLLVTVKRDGEETGRWQNSRVEPGNGDLIGARVVDTRSVEIDIANGNAAEEVVLTVRADLAGACDGPTGVARIES